MLLRLQNFRISKLSCRSGSGLFRDSLILGSVYITFLCLLFLKVLEILGMARLTRLCLAKDFDIRFDSVEINSGFREDTLVIEETEPESDLVLVNLCNVIARQTQNIRAALVFLLGDQLLL